MMKSHGRRTARTLLLVLLLTLWPATPPAYALETSATAAILVDATSGQVLYEKNADKQMLIASTTKIMTALVALRDGTLTDAVTVSRNAAGTEGSSMYLKAGETLSLEALLYGLMLSSGNDAAVAIAEHVAGSVGAFAGRMNALARSLGMSNSSFANPHGLNHPDHYSTARDMAALANAAMNNETLRRITSTKTVSLAGRTMKNHNKLLWTLDGCIGLKTGYTKAAGRTLVTCCERDGRRLIAVTLRDGDDWTDHKKMYDYGFSTPGVYMPKYDEPVLEWPTLETANLPPRETYYDESAYYPTDGEVDESAVYGAPVTDDSALYAPPPVDDAALYAPPESASYRHLTVAGNFLGEAAVTGGRWATVPLVAGATLGVQVPDDAVIDVRLELNGVLVAPIPAGANVGTAVFLSNGVEMGRVAAVCGESVPLPLPTAEEIKALAAAAQAR